MRRKKFTVTALPNSAEEHERGFHLLVQCPDFSRLRLQNQIAKFVERALNAAFDVEWRHDTKDNT